MRRVGLFLFAAGLLQGAVIRGVVLEAVSGKPLLRTTVVLQPIAGTPGAQLAVRTGRFGNFEFQDLAGGSYVVKASRMGFVPVEYGQRRWNGSGLPVVLDANAVTFLQIQMPRYGAIAGAVTDENGVGLPDFEVVAYRNTQPPQLVRRAKSDERGIYRIGGLEPGAYLVRSVARQDQQLSYLPTFSPEAGRVDDARPFYAALDEETKGADVRPQPGRLFSLSGEAIPAPQELPITVTLVSDMGRQTVNGPGFVFGGLPPGEYEVFADAPANEKLRANYQAGYSRVSITDSDVRSLAVLVSEVRPTQIELSPAPPASAEPPVLTYRQKDLAGEGPGRVLKLEAGRLYPRGRWLLLLPPGGWEMLLTPPAGYYAVDFTASGSSRPARARADGWNEILLRGAAFVRYRLSDTPGSIHGTVKSAGDPVSGAPVFLEAYDPGTRTRIGELRTTRTGVRGAYRFEGLAPGEYRILSTFEFRAPGTAEMELSGARQVQVDTRQDRELDLDLTGIR